MAQDNKATAQKLGWLDEDGICHFPRDVEAVPTGALYPGIEYPEKLSPQQLQEAVDKGWIKFIDGNGDPHTFTDYIALYPEYPDPMWILTNQGKWPPKAAYHIK